MGLGVRIWISLTGAALLALQLLLLQSPSETSLRALSVTIVLVGVAIFVAHGGRRVTVTGLFGLATALIMGYGGWVVTDLDPATPWVHTALAATAAGLIGSVPLMRGRTSTDPIQSMNRRDAAVFLWVGLLTMLALIPVRHSLPPVLHEGMAFMATLFFAAGVIYGPSRKASLAAPLIVAPHLVAYSELFHGGTGRLRLVALLGCLVILYTARNPRWWHKPAMLSAAPIGLYYLAKDRVAYQIEMFGGSNSTGLESMLASTRTFGVLVQAQAEGKEPLHYGASFFSPLTSIIPDSLHFENMPGAFPYELVRWSNPHLYDTGFSTAGSYYGEWWWNFGVAGIVLAMLVTGPLLALLDRWVFAGLARLNESAMRALWACAVLAFGGAVGDLVWAGGHTWLVRGVARMPLVLTLAAVLALRLRTPPRPDRVGQPGLRRVRSW